MCTFMFSILVLFTTTRLIRQSIGVLMEGVPDGIDPDDVEEALLNVPGVIGTSAQLTTNTNTGSDAAVCSESKGVRSAHLLVSFDFVRLLRVLLCCSAVHDLHIWSLSVGKPSLSVHLYCRDDASHVLAAANKMCARKYNIHHSTIQVERQHDDIDCNDAFQQGHASLDRITAANFADLGIVPSQV